MEEERELKLCPICNGRGYKVEGESFFLCSNCQQIFIQTKDKSLKPIAILNSCSVVEVALPKEEIRQMILTKLENKFRSNASWYDFVHAPLKEGIFERFSKNELREMLMVQMKSTLIEEIRSVVESFSVKTLEDIYDTLGLKKDEP